EPRAARRPPLACRPWRARGPRPRHPTACRAGRRTGVKRSRRPGPPQETCAAASDRLLLLAGRKAERVCEKPTEGAPPGQTSDCKRSPRQVQRFLGQRAAAVKDVRPRPETAPGLGIMYFGPAPSRVLDTKPLRPAGIPRPLARAEADGRDKLLI